MTDINKIASFSLVEVVLHIMNVRYKLQKKDFYSLKLLRACSINCIEESLWSSHLCNQQLLSEISSLLELEVLCFSHFIVAVVSPQHQTRFQTTLASIRSSDLSMLSGYEKNTIL